MFIFLVSVSVLPFISHCVQLNRKKDLILDQSSGKHGTIRAFETFQMLNNSQWYYLLSCTNTVFSEWSSFLLFFLLFIWPCFAWKTNTNLTSGNSACSYKSGQSQKYQTIYHAYFFPICQFILRQFFWTLLTHWLIRTCAEILFDEICRDCMCYERNNMEEGYF